ncbi:MAG: YceI family protein [Proteobacteria bacterium]|nr:YceI family protein [Pseudomonadota bacterium]MDA0992619.1 YceI family protein [Pseudomonadota bacterium]
MNKITIPLLLAIFTSTPALADWTLNSDASTLSFVSTKAVNVAEVSQFTSLSGGIDSSGMVEVSIALASVNTGIELRDDRMREMLFETAKFTSATMTASVDAAMLGELAVGDSMEATVNGKLALHGETSDLVMDVVVARTSDSQVLVVSKKPVVVNAQYFRLTEGIEKLREIAGLPNISTAVPVSFVLSFDAT